MLSRVYIVNSNIKNNENLNKKIDYVADKLVKSVDRTTDKISEDIYEQEEQQKKLNMLIEENNKRMNEVESKLVDQKKKIEKLETVIICEECGESFAQNCKRINHLNEHHPKHSACDLDQKIHRQNKVIRKGNKAQTFKCDECGDTFIKKVNLRTHIK